MEHANEYHDAMIATLELVWGEGFMAPGGAGNVANLVKDLDVAGKRVLDIGCGIGGPALTLARDFGARVTGIDLEAPLIDRARRYAKAAALDGESIQFRTVKAGPLDFDDAYFDVVISSGAFTQTADKGGIFRECLRVLKPGGTLSCYDWMRTGEPYSEDMHYWFKMEELTYAMETLSRHGELMEAAGFRHIALRDASDWYRGEVRREYERLRGPLYPQLEALIGQGSAQHFVEDWRAMVVVCENGEMRQGYYRGTKPAPRQ